MCEKIYLNHEDLAYEPLCNIERDFLMFNMDELNVSNGLFSDFLLCYVCWMNIQVMVQDFHHVLSDNLLVSGNIL